CQIYAHYDGPRPACQNIFSGWGDLAGSRSSTAEFVEAKNGAVLAFDHSTKVLDADRKSELPAAISDIGRSIDVLKKAPSLSAKSDDLMSQLLTLMQDQYELLKDIDRGGTVTLLQDRRASQNARKYSELMDAFDSCGNA